MFKPTDAKSADEYLAMLDSKRRKQLRTLDTLIKKTVPDLKRWFTYNMIGYGAFDYIDYKKQSAKWPVIALASQKNYMSLYVCAVNDENGGQYLAEKYKKELYKDGVRPNIGKSCIRFNKIEDLNLPTLKKVLKEAVRKPGLVGYGGHKKS